MQAAHNQHKHEAHAADQQRPFPVTDKNDAPFCFPWRLSWRLRRWPAPSWWRLPPRPVPSGCGPRCSGIVALDFLFLPEPGNGIAHRLRRSGYPAKILVDIFGVGGNGFPFRFGCGPVGFELVVPDAAADALPACRSASSSPCGRPPRPRFRPRLHGFCRGRTARLPEPGGSWDWTLAWGRFLHLVKAQLGLGSAGCLVVDSFRGDNTLFRQPPSLAAYSLSAFFSALWMYWKAGGQPVPRR